MKITKNFSFWEFGPNGCSKSWVPDNEYQKRLITDLALNLQILRDLASKKISISISSGVRTIEDFYRLQGSGYNPSETSDHFCGNAVPIKSTSEKYKKFGPTYNFSVGAADCIPSGISVINFFQLAMNAFRDSKVKFGQIIYEKNKKVEWVHLSNDYEKYFSMQTVEWLAKTRFMKSIDGGKTYTIASV